MTSLRTESLWISSSPIGENPFPIFHDQGVLRDLHLKDSFPLELREMIGWQTFDRILPYRDQDRYSRQLILTQFKTIILENEWLAATFLPELGGRLISLMDKSRGKELLSRNPELQPANLAIRNAWISGGIEWNVGRYGHSVFTCLPVFAAEIKDWNGQPGLRLYEFERTQGLFWQIDFFLPSDSKFLLAHTRVLNPRGQPTSMYWWTNIAVPEGQDVRVLAPAQKAINLDPSNKSFYVSDMVHSPLTGADATYPTNSVHPDEFFMLTQSADMPWITALDKNGYGLVEASTPRLGARKLFCWGMGPSGRRWQKYLSPSGKPYFEIQAGLAPTQLHGLVMPGHASWDWTEAFGALEADPQRTHHENWNTAWSAVDAALKQVLTPDQLFNIERRCQMQMDLPGRRFLNEGSGWGALELARFSAQEDFSIPAAFVFPGFTLGDEQQRWLSLLNEDVFPLQSARVPPGEWVTQKEWRVLLESSLRRGANRSWYAWLHLGVMLFESSDEFGAEQAWLESIALQPSVWAFRNMGVLCRARNQFKEALAYYRSAWLLAQTLGLEDQTFLAKEYLQLLYEVHFDDQAIELYQSLPNQVQGDDRIQILRGQIALECNDLETVEGVLEKEYAVIRENETILSDLWYEVAARRLASSTGRPLDDALRTEVRCNQHPPERLDF